jgi:hypothetical protein
MASGRKISHTLRETQGLPLLEPEDFSENKKTQRIYLEKRLRREGD